MALGLLLNEPVAAVVILIMLTGGEALEDYAMSRAESGIHELLEQEPGTARRILADGSMEEVQATDLAVGDSVMLRTGDTTPVDCEVSESANTTPREGEDGAPGSFEVDESMLTGEALPQKKVVGDTVHAGSINISSHPLRTIVLKAHADSAMTMFKATLAAALEKQSQLRPPPEAPHLRFGPFAPRPRPHDRHELGKGCSVGRALLRELRRLALVVDLPPRRIFVLHLRPDLSARHRRHTRRTRLLQERRHALNLQLHKTVDGGVDSRDAQRGECEGDPLRLRLHVQVHEGLMHLALSRGGQNS